jgi:hypothetical protein
MVKYIENIIGGDQGNEAEFYLFLVFLGCMVATGFFILNYFLNIKPAGKTVSQPCRLLSKALKPFLSKPNWQEGRLMIAFNERRTVSLGHRLKIF